VTVAIILAGGTGQRMGLEIPKQYVKVLGKPVIVHTLEVFENNPEIDKIVVVSVPAYISEVEGYRQKFNINKLSKVIAGGDIFQDSVRNGLMNIQDICTQNDIIMLAMSVSPLITDDIIADSIRVCHKYGNAFSAAHSIYNLSKIIDGHYADNYVLKEEHVTLNLPWTMPYGKILGIYEKAYRENIGTDIRSYTPTLLIDIGEKIYFSKDSQANRLKLTTTDDLAMLEGYLISKNIRNSHMTLEEIHHEIFSGN